MDALTFRRRSSHRRLAFMAAFTLLAGFITTGADLLAGPAPQAVAADTTESLRRAVATTTEQPVGNYSGTAADYGFTPSSTWAAGDPMTAVGGSVDYTNLLRYQLDPGRVIRFSFNGERATSAVSVDAGAVDQAPAGTVVTDAWFELADIDQTRAVFDFTASTIDGTVVTDISRIDVGLSFGGDGGGSHTVVDRGNGAFRVVFTGTGTGQGAGAVDSNGRLTMRMNDGTLLGGMRVALVSQTWNDFMAIDYRRVVTDLPADFGDAPDSYGTTAAANGAQHALVGLDATSGTAPLMLGASVDAEADGAPSALADADGTDEDALVAADAASVDAGAPSIDVAVRNDTAEAATLAGWLDLDGDGAFETGELVTAPVPASSGATTIELAFPAGTAGQSMLRLRLLPGAVSEPAATGAVVGGEVEDHLVTLTDLPYTCTTSTQFLAQGIPSQLIRMEQTAAGYTFEDVGPPAAQSYNAIGFNPVDGYLYASFGGPIYRVDPETGATENTGASFPAGTGIPSGAVSADGIYYVRRNPGPIHRIDLQNLDAGYTSITPTPNLPHGSDFTFAAGDSRYLWGKSAGTLTRIDLETGTAVAIAGVGTGFGVFGAAFAFGNGDLGFQNNSTGGVDRIRITSNGAVPTAELIGVIPGPSSGANDGASCIGSPTDLAVEKTAPATVDPSGQVSYDITVTNVGPGNSSGYVVRDEMPAGLTGIASSSPGVSISGSTVTIVGGALAAGESASYRITANGPPTGCVTNTAEVAGNEGDPVASNDSASATTCFGDQPADFGDAPSTFGTTLAEDGPRHDVPQLDAATGTAPLMLGATVDVEADGTPSAAADGDGTDEDGLAAAALRRSAPVAEITVVNDTGETATLAGWLDLDGDGLFEAAELVTATVPAGSGSSTLSLAFPAATATGDVLSRFRLYPGEVAAPTPGGAAAGGEVEDHLVTLTTAPALTIAKSSDASAATRIGDTVTYTVTATNTGDADFTEAAPATVIDDLTGVLDDASFNDDATASAGAPTYAEPRLTWQGPLEVGASVTLTYSVTLTGAGDHVVENVAFAADCEPGTPCEPVTPPVPECVDGGTDPVTGLSCDVVSFAIPALAIAKSADHSVVSADGETVTYTVEATNTGAAPFTEERPAVVIDDLSGVLDDATLDVSSIAADRGDAPVYAEPRIQWSGALGVGETVTLTYAVTSTGAGDSRLVNVAFGPECDADDPTCAETPPVTPVCDPADADGLDPASGEPCDRVEIPMSNLSVSKDADPADGSTVVAGDEVTYSVSFTNTGSAPAAVDRWTDHLTGVLDDAAVTVQPVASSDALVASAIADGMFTVSGSVPAGETVTVSYTVRVLADGARGDDVLANVVTPPGVEPPAECATGDALCTEHVVPEIVASKGVDPASGSTVAAGQVLTYTLTFGNEGAAAGGVDEVDHVGQLVDDAEITSAPIASDTALTVSEITDGQFAITGTLEPGQTVTVTYQATVLPDGQRGDDQLANFLLPPGTEPPTEPVCEPGDARCTVNPVRALLIEKSADATVVDADGQTVTYTVQATNVGAAAYTEALPAVVIDDLSGVLDDADLDVASLASDRGAAPSFAEPRIQWSGALGVGETVTLTYTVTFAAGGGDGTLVNVAFAPSCESGDPTCAETPPATPVCDPAVDGLDPSTGMPCDRVEIPTAQLTVSKDSDPADGSTVVAGDEVTYTLSFANAGTTAAPVEAWTDHLSGVLDDAEVTVQPVASSDALVASAIADDVFTVSGEVPAGETITVSYTVRVLADGARGDDVLANVVTPPGVEPPAECAADDALCTEHVVPEIVAAKSVDPASGSTVTAGQVLTYTLTFSNEGAAVGRVDAVDDLTHLLDDAEVSAAPVASDAALTVSEVADGRFGITGELQPGQTATVTYQATVLPDGARGDDVLGNFLLEPGEEPPAEPVCEDGAEDCTVNPVPEIVESKGVDPASGTTVEAGQVLTYTLTFGNDGAAAGEVDAVDDLTHLLDDAVISAAPVASDEALSVTEIQDGRLGVTGTLDPGQIVTVTYQATVLPDGERGDDTLGNFLLEPGQEPPAEPVCEDGAEDCTVNPVPHIVDAKGVDPTSGTTVTAGQVLTYTLTFSNEGAAAGRVDAVDDLTHLLDDAEVSAAPVASDAALTVSEIADGRFGITGELQPGQTATVTYQTTVLPDGARGDDVLGNFLLEPGQEPPAEPVCEDGTEDCTVNPVPEIVESKGVDPESGSTVTAGQVLTYTLTFGNEGAAAGQVDAVDDLTHLLDDAELSALPVASDAALTVSEVADGRFGITGALQPGQTVTVTYQATVLPDSARGDDTLANFLLPPGAEPPAEPVCEDGAEDCTVNLVPRIVDAKLADPASGSTVLPGQVVTYTLRFENLGTGAGAIDRIDDLTHVLDDATLVSEPVSSLESVTAERLSETQLGITGTLGAGETATVSYRVMIGEAGSGDGVLGNYLADPGFEPPAEPVCEEGSEDCTVHPVPAVTIVKGSDPASGTEVAAGDVVTYTLTIGNTGQAEGPVSFTDHMAGVLDDADLVEAPTVDDAAVTATLDGDRIVLEGSIAAGDTITVTYAVQVRAWEAQGDHAIGNVVTATGEEPPGVCVEGSVLCTEHEATPPPEPGVPGEPGEPGVPGEPGEPGVPGDPELPRTGAGVPSWLLLAAALLLLAGAALVLMRRRALPRAE